MIVTQDLTKIYQTKDGRSIVGIEGLDLKINSGEIVGLFGANGAGKTTTINLLSTIISPSRGGAIVAGHDIIADPIGVRSIIGLAGDVPGFYPRLSAWDNLDFFAKLCGIDNRKNKIVDLAKKFDVFDVLDRKVGSFSKGMTQKLLLAKALLNDPEVLMLDEPWSGLSPVAQRELKELLSQITADENRTVIISTHNLPQAERIVNRILIIKKGRLLMDSTPERIREKFMIQPELSIKFEANDHGKLDKILSDMDFVSAWDFIAQGVVKVKISSFNMTPDLIKNMAIADVRLHEVKEIVPSLEEIYLDLVGGEEQ